MKTTVKEILSKELIGLKAEVSDSKNKSNIGIKGNIENETKNTIIINKKRLFKNNITLKIKEIIIKGENLTKRSKKRK